VPLLIAVVLFGIGWVLLIRPQRQRIREQQAVVATLAVGDHVITAGGIHGVITEVAEDTVEIEVAPGVVLTLARPAISRRVDAEPAPGSAPADEPATEPRSEEHVTDSLDQPVTGDRS